jgi:hypothetical protein
MSSCTIKSDRRSEMRMENGDTMRWKRPGKFEDHKAWMVDRSPSGLGFLTQAGVAPRVGEILNIRRLDDDRWATLDRAVRVVRADPATDESLTMVGCRLE